MPLAKYTYLCVKVAQAVSKAFVSSSDCFASCGVMASSAPYKQDLPPKGGYAPINFRRIPARQVDQTSAWEKLFLKKSCVQVLNAPIIFTGLIGSMAVGHWLYKRGMRTWKTWVSAVHEKLRGQIR